MTNGVQLAAYRIAVEAITNAARHSGGTACDVLLEMCNASLRVTVSDNGHGFGPDTVPGVGFTSMLERASEVGGRLTFDGDDRGLTILAEIPVPCDPR